MAEAVKRTMKKTTKKDTTPITQENKTEVKNPKKVFAPDDLIETMSITAGEMFFEGQKSGELYSWADLNYVTEIEFQDLNYAIRRRDEYVFRPRFIILNEEFIKLYPELDKVYSGLYSTQDLREILDLSSREIKDIVSHLPLGAKDALKSIVVTEIDAGRYSDIQRIKVFDKIFETDMLGRAMNVN